MLRQATLPTPQEPALVEVFCPECAALTPPPTCQNCHAPTETDHRDEENRG